jgi:hypothetical protein
MVAQVAQHVELRESPPAANSNFSPAFWAASLGASTKRAELSEKPVQSSGSLLINVTVHHETLKVLGEISIAIQLLLPNPNDSFGR